MATALRSTVQPPETHPTTGLPIQRVTEFEVGDLVTEGIGSDGYPGVVVAVEGKGKTIYVRRVNFVVGNATASSHANYLDDTTIAIDPESVEQALALGKGEKVDGQRGASKYVLRVAAQPARPTTFEEQERLGPLVHRARWAVPGANYGGVSKGARYRQDPHL